MELQNNEHPDQLQVMTWSDDRMSSWMQMKD